jgi:MSHA pilin protein MshC
MLCASPVDALSFRLSGGDWQAQGGFTLVELVIVLILSSVLAVYAVPRLINTSDFYARGFHDQSLAYLRFAQKTAIAQRRTVCVDLSSNTIRLRVANTAGSNTCASNLIGPDGRIDTADNIPRLTARAGISMSKVGAGGTSVPPVSFNFDALGQPVDSSTGAAAAIQVLQVANVTKSITIEAITGYIHE